MSHKNIIAAFWWSSVKFEKKKFENFGDIIGPYLIQKISGKEVRFVQPKKRKLLDIYTTVYVTAGSILAHLDKKCIVWGSGLIDHKTSVSSAIFLAVRGPETRNCLIKQGLKVPEIYGDPALLLPKYFTSKNSKKFKIGIIPHYVDFPLVSDWYADNPEIKTIDLLNNSIENIIDEICSCENIISSSLHGIIVSHAYSIPAVWVKFSDKLFGDGIKFKDYFESVKVHDAVPVIFGEKISYIQLIDLINHKKIEIEIEIIESLQKGLMGVCPFKSL
jgi:pyruvyltransferase